jgi:two-component system, NtrC family, nitrogen regulation response regulator GlnG
MSTFPAEARRPASDAMVLLVDDDDVFRSALAANLREDGHRVEEFHAPRDLPELATLEEVSVLITDYQLSGEDGLTLADRFHGAHPRAPVFMVTSYWTEHLEAEAARRDFLTLLRKPLDYDEIARLLALPSSRD